MNDFYLFYEETYLEFQRFLILNSKQLDKVDDLLQDAYLKLYMQMKKKEIQDKKAYLFKIGWNLIKKEYKIKFDSPLVENVCCSNKKLEEELFSKMTLESLWESVKKKDIIIQKCIYLYYLGMSIEEISNLLNLKTSSVKNYLYRTFKELKEEFS